MLFVDLGIFFRNEILFLVLVSATAGFLVKQHSYFNMFSVRGGLQRVVREE